MAKIIKTFLLVFAGYLLQVCVMPYLPLGSVTANLLIACMAVITVAYGRFFAFGAGAVLGILMEIMVAPINYFYLLIYPVMGFLGGLLFSDKTERRLEQERSMGKRAKDLPPLLRTLLCAGMNISVFQAVNLIYTYLTGVDLTPAHIGRALVGILYTFSVTGIIMLPLRRFLGVGRRQLQTGRKT